ncbi:hypothetical protein VPHF99_0083 [Vibrio phage F99]
MGFTLPKFYIQETRHNGRVLLKLLINQSLI